jgi:hypothetical protein
MKSLSRARALMHSNFNPLCIVHIDTFMMNPHISAQGKKKKKNARIAR